MSNDQEKAFEVTCPCCQATLWVDPLARSVVKSEKAARKKASLDDLLLKEKQKKEAFESKFEATAEIEKQKRQKAKEKFEKAFDKLDETDK